nr:uncharacterized protein LOC128699746 [Cherax quadricarinatus]
MDEYEQKNNSGNALFQIGAITKLHTKMLEKNQDGSSLYETEEVKCLWQTANKGDIAEATLAIETLVALVKAGLLPLPATLQNFLADITNAKSPSSLVKGVSEIVLLSQVETDGELQCPFTGPPSGPVHPFVTIITKKPDLISTVLEEVAGILRHPERRVRTSNICHIRPLVLHTFCLTEKTLGIAQPLLSLIVSSHISHAELNIVPLLCRVAPLIKDSSRDHVERKIMVLTALAEIAVGSNLTRLQSALLPCLVMAVPFALVRTQCQNKSNEHWETLCCTFSSLVSYIPALEFSDRLVRDPQLASDWLTKLASSINQISSFYHTIVTSVFLYQGSTSQSVQQATKVLEREVMKKKALSLEVFPMVLYRLGREVDPTTRLTLLYTLPSLAVNKLCVALVLKTLLAFWSSGSLRPLVLRLVYDLWTVEPRTYSYLSQLIHDKSINTNEIQIARAFIVASICKAKPSQHGEELLPLLSGFLNECKSDDGTPQTLIALDGIYDLCANQIIDLRTTWRVIAPKLVRDKRPGVTEKLCALLGLVPVLHVASVEYEKFTSDAVTILWNWIASHRSLSVVKAAYMSLEKFKYDDYTLKMLPQYARMGHQLPASMAATPFEAARKAEDVLNYVPGLAWVKLIKGCPESHLVCVESFINSLVSREVAALPKGIYLTAIQEAKRRGIKGVNGQPEPQSYSFFKEMSILKAIVNFLLDFSNLMKNCEHAEVKQRLLRCSVLMLEALGQSLPRPYPALDWSFLENVLISAQSTCNYDWITRIRHSLFQIAARQCNKSNSASALISKWLVPAPSNGLTREDEIVLFKLLDHLGRGLPPTVLQPFVAYVFNQHMSETVHMKKLLEALKPNLTADFIFDTNRNVLSNAIENLNEHIDPANEVMYVAYKACVADLPLKHIERLTSPSLWWEVTDERLYRAAVLRCHVAEKDPEELALPWLNDLVDSAAALPGDRSHLLRVMSNTLVVRCRVKESTTWFLQLLGRLRDHLKAKPGDNLVAAHEQQQRVTFYLDLVVMGLLVWSDLWATNQMEVLAESPALRDRLLLPSIVTLSGQTEWKQTLNQLLNWLLSSHSLMGEHASSRYHLSSPTLLLATLNPDLTQIMWNKVIALVI